MASNSKSIKKGEVKNPNGRPVGAVNKQTAAVRDALSIVMAKLESTMMKDIDLVTPQRRLQFFTDLMQYIKPKLSTTKADIDINTDSKVEFIIRYENNIPSVVNNQIDI
jgi:hypothetical protein